MNFIDPDEDSIPSPVLEAALEVVKGESPFAAVLQEETEAPSSSDELLRVLNEILWEVLSFS